MPLLTCTRVAVQFNGMRTPIIGIFGFDKEKWDDFASSTLHRRANGIRLLFHSPHYTWE